MRLQSRIGVIRINRALSGVLAVMLAGLVTPAFAQELVPTHSRPLFTQEALRRAASAAMRDTALPSQATPKPATASEPGPNRSWETLLDTVQKGKKVTVTLMTMENIDGKLVAIDERSLTIEQPGGAQTIQAADVFRVRYAGIRSRRTGWGMLIGASAMAIFGAVTSRDPYTYKASDGSTHTVANPAIEGAAICAIFLGLPGGAIVGAAMPIGPPLYEAAAVVR